MRPSAASRRRNTSSLSMSGRVLTSVTPSPRITLSSGRSAPARLRSVLRVLNIVTVLVGPPLAKSSAIAPDRSCRATRVLVELDGTRHLRFGDENDLAKVESEMLHHLVDGLEHTDISRLYPPTLRELLRFQPRKHG